MPPRAMTPEQVEEARSLRGDGASWRELGRYFGLDHQTVRRWVEPETRERYRAVQRARHVAKPQAEIQRKWLRDQARAQAREEGVDYEVVYERWGVPTRRASLRFRDEKCCRP